MLTRIWGRPQRPVAETPLQPPQPAPKEDNTHPYPVTLVISHSNGATAIMRGWEPGAPANCRLCAKGTCTADVADRCLVLVPIHLEDNEVAMFSLRTYNAVCRSRRLGR